MENDFDCPVCASLWLRLESPSLKYELSKYSSRTQGGQVSTPLGQRRAPSKFNKKTARGRKAFSGYRRLRRYGHSTTHKCDTLAAYHHPARSSWPGKESHHSPAHSATR